MLTDQRGCGRSLPHASADRSISRTNTTWHLVADLERLREARGIERWQVFGGSWGSALALAYAETHPERVTELIVRGDLHPAPQRAGLLLQRRRPGSCSPSGTSDYLAPLGGRGFRGDTIAAYHELLFDPDPAVHGPAAVAWSTWEAATITLEPDAELFARLQEPAYAAGVRPDREPLLHPRRLVRRGPAASPTPAGWPGIPGVIVQGRYDVATPAVTAWDLHRAWPSADLRMVAVAGHADSEPGIAAELVAATDRFAG